MDEVAIVDRVQVDLDDLSKLGEHVAIPPAEQLEVVYFNTETRRQRRAPVLGFNGAGEALVLADRGSRLIAARHGSKPGERIYVQRVIEETPDTPVGPFTAAPAGLIAVFKDGLRLPIAYYDVHGRSLCIDNLGTRGLFVLDEDDDTFDQVEGDPQI